MLISKEPKIIVFFFNYYYCLKYKSLTYIKIYHMNNVVQKFIYDYISNIRLPFIYHSYTDISVRKMSEKFVTLF